LFLKSFFLKNITKITSPSAKGQRAGKVLAPLLDAFRTFYWSEIIKERLSLY